MAANIDSSSGIAEDLIRAIVQTGCAEVHAKTLLEKANAELEHGIIDVNEKRTVTEHLEHMNDLTEEITLLAALRRDMMRHLHSMYPDGDRDYWCMIKHLGVAAYCAFEVYQASDDDPELLEMALRANKRFIKALSHFLGAEPMACASCMADFLKGRKENTDGMG